MTTYLWPQDLPQRFLISGYSQALRDGRLRTAMDSGPPKLRRRNRSATFPVSGQFYATFDLVAVLRKFFEENVGGGTIPFLLPDQLADGLLLADETGSVICDDDGDPLGNSAWWLCTFGEQVPQVQMQSGQLCRVSLVLAVLP